MSSSSRRGAWRTEGLAERLGQFGGCIPVLVVRPLQRSSDKSAQSAEGDTFVGGPVQSVWIDIPQIVKRFEYCVVQVLYVMEPTRHPQYFSLDISVMKCKM